MAHFGEGRRRVLRRAEEVIRGEEEIGGWGVAGSSQTLVASWASMVRRLLFC